MKHTGICVTSLVGGMIIGSALAMLLTPQSGPELRHKLKDMAVEGIDKAKNQADKMQQMIKEQIEQARCKCESHEA